MWKREIENSILVECCLEWTVRVNRSFSLSLLPPLFWLIGVHSEFLNGKQATATATTTTTTDGKSVCPYYWAWKFMKYAFQLLTSMHAENGVIINQQPLTPNQSSPTQIHYSLLPTVLITHPACHPINEILCRLSIPQLTTNEWTAMPLLDCLLSLWKHR